MHAASRFDPASCREPRRVVFGDGTAASFVIVATMFLGAALLGWRALARLVESRRQPATQSSGGSLTAK